MGDFFGELKRRHIYRVAAAYAVVAWVVIQLVNNVSPMLNLPNVVGTAVLVLLAAGFPIALIFAWIAQISSSEAVKAATGKNDWVLIGILFAVLAAIAYEQFVSAPATKGEQQASVVAGRQAGAPPSGISLAVLPFSNLSSDKEQEFFSDGMTDEIMTALAKISALRVVGRESAFQFKGQRTDMKAVGQALGAVYLIEGSVRKAGDQVRITAQLVQADTGVSVWTESYDRELKNIFATQSDIAQAIAGALRVPLGLKQGDTLVRNRTNSVESYDQYLRAKALIRSRGLMPVTEGAALLEQVVARDPDYAPAWALLAQAYSLTPQYYQGLRASVEELRRVVDASAPKAEAAARRAIRLDESLADGHLALALAQASRGKLLPAEDLFKQALAMDANNPDALHIYSDILAEAGRLKEALAMRRQLQILEPFVPIYNENTARVLWVNGENETAIAAEKALPPAIRGYGLARMYASIGRYGEAADELLEVGAPETAAEREVREAVVRMLRALSTGAVASSEAIPARLGRLDWVYLYTETPGRALELHEEATEAGYAATINVAMLWHPSFAPVRKTERFKNFVRKAGLVEYWRARGWPEFCHPATGDDFECH